MLIMDSKLWSIIDMKSYLRVTVAIALFFGVIGFAGAEASISDVGGVKWKAGIDGVEIEWSPNGGVERMYSTVYQAVEFNDRRGINNGYKIAELKAKSAIVKFIKQSVSSRETYNELQAELNTALQKRKTGEGVVQEKVDERKFTASFQEAITSVASGNLSGVVILERGYSEKDSEVWVSVGISDRTKRAANAAKEFSSDAASIKDGKENSDSRGIQIIPSEIRKSKNLDSF
jgi:hypothetical protein